MGRPLGAHRRGHNPGCRVGGDERRLQRERRPPEGEVPGHSDHDDEHGLAQRGCHARFRILGEQGNVIQPGAAEFAPSGIESFSYTFVTSVGTFEADDRHSLQVQWRSTTGAAVTLRRGALNVLYERGLSC